MCDKLLRCRKWLPGGMLKRIWPEKLRVNGREHQPWYVCSSRHPKRPLVANGRGKSLGHISRIWHICSPVRFGYPGYPSLMKSQVASLTSLTSLTSLQVLAPWWLSRCFGRTPGLFDLPEKKHGRAMEHIGKHIILQIFLDAWCFTVALNWKPLESLLLSLLSWFPKLEPSQVFFSHKVHFWPGKLPCLPCERPGGHWAHAEEGTEVGRRQNDAAGQSGGDQNAREFFNNVTFPLPRILRDRFWLEFGWGEKIRGGLAKLLCISWLSCQWIKTRLRSQGAQPHTTSGKDTLCRWTWPFTSGLWSRRGLCTRFRRFRSPRRSLQTCGCWLSKLDPSCSTSEAFNFFRRKPGVDLSILQGGNICLGLRLAFLMCWVQILHLTPPHTTPYFP